MTLFIKTSSWRFLKWFNFKYVKNPFQVMIMLIYNVLVWYGRYFKIFKHLLKQDSVDQNGVFMTRHLPSQECKQNSYLSGLQNRKKSLLILYHAHFKIQLFVMFCILSDLINSLRLETFHIATLTVNSPLSTITCRRMSTTLWRFLILKLQISLVLLIISKKVVIKKTLQVWV